MPTFNWRQVDRALKRKLGCLEVSDRDHYTYELRDGDMTRGITIMSRSRPDVHANLQSLMARQLHVSTATFRGMVSCPVTRDQFLEEVISNSEDSAG